MRTLHLELAARRWFSPSAFITWPVQLASKGTSPTAVGVWKNILTPTAGLLKMNMWKMATTTRKGCYCPSDSFTLSVDTKLCHLLGSSSSANAEVVVKLLSSLVQ